MRRNVLTKHLATAFILFACSGVFAQTHPENFVIMNVESGRVLETEPGCDLKPGNNTDGVSFCGVHLSSYSEGKKSQLWKITEDKGTISIQSVLFNRYLKASTNVTIISRDNEPFFFKPVAAKDGNYLLLQVTADNAALRSSYNTLQPVNDETVCFKAFDEKLEARQSWKIVPVKEKPTDYLGMSDQKLTKKLADDVSKNLTGQSNVNTLVDKAHDLIAKRDFDGAISLLQQALQTEPKNEKANLELAEAYWNKKDYANAGIYGEKARSVNPNNELTWNLLGLIFRDQQQWEKAIWYFQTVVEINRKANISFANLAYCYDNLGKPEEAITNYSKAIDISIQEGYKPASYMYNNRGSAYRKLNKNNEAIADFRKALEADPDNKTAKDNLEALLKTQQQDTPGRLTLDARPNTPSQGQTTTKDPNQGKGNYYQTCRVCCGSGKVNNDGYIEQCPECEGKGKVAVGHNYTHITKCE